MKTKTTILAIGIVMAGLLLLQCDNSSPTASQVIDGAQEIQPTLKLAKSLSLADVSSAEVVVSGGTMSGSQVFALLVDPTGNKLYGTLKIPAGVTSCNLEVHLKDLVGRKIGQGSCALTPSNFAVGRCVTPVIGIESAKPKIVSAYATPSVVGINDSIQLFAAAADSFNGFVTKYEWKFGSNPWVVASSGNVNLVAPATAQAYAYGILWVTAPATAQAYACSLRVTDNEGNTAMDVKMVTVEVRPPVANAGIDTAVGINDSIYLHGTGTDETAIVTYEWKCGAGLWVPAVNGNLGVAAPATAQAYACSLRVTDNDGNTAMDVKMVTVEARPPLANAGLDMAVQVNENISLHGIGTDETAIAKYEWKIGTNGWVVTSSGDTNIIAPTTAQSYVCSLRVTDNDGNSSVDAVVISMGGTLSDIEGNVYMTKIIGTQEWTVENLRVTRYNDSTLIPLVTDNAAWVALTTPAYCQYNNRTNVDSIKKWGALYNWYVVDPANVKKIAPAGWHVPTDAEWATMENYLIANRFNGDGTTTGNKIAQSLAAKTDWLTSRTNGAIGMDLAINDRSGFSALPGGCRDYNGAFGDVGSIGGWWSATANDAAYAYYRYLYYKYDYLDRHSLDKSSGFSVRLVRD